MCYGNDMKSLITNRQRSCSKCGSKNLIDYRAWWHAAVDNVDVEVTTPMDRADANAAGVQETYRCGDCDVQYHKRYTSPGCEPNP